MEKDQLAYDINHVYREGYDAGIADGLQGHKASRIAYIAGPITGVAGYRDNFSRAARYARRCGCATVLNPAESVPSTLDNEKAMKICFAMIDVADVVFFMPEWRRSRGATLEHAYCEYLKKEIQYLPAKP